MTRLWQQAILVGLLFLCMAIDFSAQSGPGAEWIPKVNLAGNLAVQCSYRSSIAVDISGTVHVIWGECLGSEPDYPARARFTTAS